MSPNIGNKPQGIGNYLKGAYKQYAKGRTLELPLVNGKIKVPEPPNVIRHALSIGEDGNPKTLFQQNIKQCLLYLQI